jgi:Flp pilus assembly protein TadD
VDELSQGTARARALLEAGRPADALAAVLPDLATDPDNFSTVCTAAEAQIALNDGDEAVRLARHAIALQPESEWAFRLLAYGHMVDQRLGPARDAAQRAVDLRPDAWYTHLARAAVDIDGGRISPQAVYSAEMAVQLAPLEPEAHLAWGQIMRMDRNPHGAEAEFREALRLDPQNPRAMMELGIANLRSGDAAMASRAFVDILATDSDSRAALFNLRVAAGLVVRTLTWMLLALTGVGWIFVAAVSLSHSSGAADRVHIPLIVASVLTLAALVFSILRVRRIVGHRFDRFAASIVHVDRLLAIWVAMLVIAVGLSIWAIFLPVAAAAWVYFGALAIVIGAKYLESERRKKLIIERNAARR